MESCKIKHDEQGTRRVVCIHEIEDNTDNLKLWDKRQKRIWISALFLGSCMLYATRTVMPLSMVSIGEEKLWNKRDCGMVLSAFFWGYTTTQVLGGYLSDKIGGATVLATAALGWSFLTLYTPWLVTASSNHDVGLHITVLSRVFVGAFQGVYFPSLTNIVSNKVGKSGRSFSFSAVNAGTTLGTLLSGSLGSLLLERYGWHMPFYLIGTLAMAWAMFMQCILLPTERRREIHVSAKELSNMYKIEEKLKVPWMEIFSNMSFWAIIVAHVCQNNAFYVLLSWLPTYFHDNFPVAKGWVFNVVPWAVTIPSIVSAGYLADQLINQGFTITFVRKLANTVAMCGCGVFLLCLPYTTSYEGALFIMAMATACTGFHSAGVLMNPQDIAPKYAGSVFGLMNTAGSIPGFVGVYIAGYILQVTGSWAAVFNLTAAVSFVGWLVFTLFGTGKQIVS